MIKFDAKKTGIFAAGVAFGTAGIKVLQVKMPKIIYKLHSSRFTCKILHYENSFHNSGKC